MDKLTIFYNIRTGTIKELCSGEQTMEWFGDEKQDYEQIFNFIIIEYDEYVMQNSHQFEVSESILKLRSDTSITKYM